ncbi:MAG: GHKL domain-containing protein [Bacteriovoracaceae bacterium]|nr:GHKL domain-containing protein [Bacteriovoracaceae bacterium]
MASKIKSYSSMDFYLFASLSISLVIWASLYFMGSRDWGNSFFATSFVVGSFYYFSKGVGHGDLFKESRYYSILFIFQIISLVGIGLQEQIVGAIYLSLIPSCMGHYHSMVFEGISRFDRTRTGLGFFIVPVLGVAIFESSFDGNLLFGQEGIFLTTFLCWSVMTIYTGAGIFKGKKLNLPHLFNGENRVAPKVDRGQEDRLFFHDVINQTHGMNLMLGNRISKGVGINASECRDLMGEIRVVQAQIKDHYKFTHKNLVNNYEFVSFEFAKRWIERTVSSFLPSGLVDSTFVYNGYVADDASYDEKKLAVIHYPSFSRILTNMIKNISEVKAYDVHLEFDFDDSGMILTVKNKVFDQNQNAVNLEHKLRESILNSERNPVLKNELGLGLESISALCKEQGGEFNFYLEDGYWVNKVYLPSPSVTNDQLAA